MATVHIESTVINESLNISNITLYAIITDRDGKKIGQTTEQPVSLAVNEKRTVKQKLTVNDPRLWSLEDPYLYRVIPVVKGKW
ncbi:MAG: hypothetical protein IPG38_15770 [Chitinophagaceae bacterium]|nr:hypothetical protein [Chitinophagaceae bacterium]